MEYPMNETIELPHPDFTPEQKAAIYAKYKKQFSVEDLIGYIEDDEPVIPAEESLAKLRETIRHWSEKTDGAN